MEKKTKDELKAVSLYLSEREKKVEDVEYEFYKIYALNFLKDKIGEEFTGIITKLDNFGITIELSEYPIEGFISYDNIYDDFYVYYPDRYITCGRRTNRVFRIGMEVKVIILKIDFEEQKLFLEFVK